MVRYKVALFNGGSLAGYPSIAPVSNSDTAKLYGLTQIAITNFNPATARVWLHNDLNTNNTLTGLQSGFHILRARTFLPRPGKSGVYNTFLQTFYYSAGLPTGVIAFPGTDGSTISSTAYNVVIRTDDSVNAVDFNIQDGDPKNDDTTAGQANGNGSSNGVPIFVSGTLVTPDPTVSAQFPGYPREFRFNYNAIPTNGTATFTVRLKDYAAAIYTNRFTTLTRTVNTQAPEEILRISSPATDGMVIPLGSNTVYLIQTCFTPTLTTTNANLFAIYINGVLQPRSQYIFRPTGTIAGCSGLRALLYNWSGAAPGTNVIQVIFTGALTLSDTRTIIVPPPPRISGLDSNHQLVVWDSIPNAHYQVLATTNLSQPFAPISPIIPATDVSTSYFDNTPAGVQKFYEVEVVP